ncbi:unnamed protein product [Symbiodinium microadriaticum]|nr:unnamed protein product [Symbiodinium microadriaticum]
MHDNPKVVLLIRANLLKWIVTQGLAEAVRNRKALAKLVNAKIEGLMGDVPMSQKPKPSGVQPGEMRPAVGESVSYMETGRNKLGTQDTEYDYHRNVPTVHDVDVFSPIARREIFEELGQLAQGIDPDSFWEDIDRKWFNELEPQSVPIKHRGYEQVSMSLENINNALEEKGFEPFHFGGTHGYMQFVEKGDYLPRSQRFQSEDPNQQHGPDLSRFKTFKKRSGEEVIDFTGIPVSADLDAYAKALGPMRRNFNALANGIKTGAISPDELGDQYQQIASAVSGGQFKFSEPTEFSGAHAHSNAAKATFGLDKKKKFPALLIPKLAKAIKVGLSGELRIGNGALGNLVAGTKNGHIVPTGNKHKGADGFTISQELQDHMFNMIFKGIPEDVMTGEYFGKESGEDEKQLQFDITPRLAWKTTIQSSPFLGDQKKLGNLKAGQRWEIAQVVGNAYKIDKSLVTPDLQARLKERPDPSEFMTKNKIATHELTPEVANQLIAKGYKFNGRRVETPEEVFEIIASDGTAVASKGSDKIKLAQEKDKFVMHIHVAGDEPFKVDFDAGDVSHLLGGGQLPQAQGRGHVMAFPMRHYEDQTAFIDELKQGAYGEPSNGAAHAHEMSTVKTAANAAFKNATWGGKTRGGLLITPELLERHLGIAHGGILAQMYGDEALRQLSGNRVMKWGFITDEDYAKNKKWDVDSDVEKEAESEISEGEGGRSLKSLLVKRLGVDMDTDDYDPNAFLEDMVQAMSQIVDSGGAISQESLSETLGKEIQGNQWEAIEKALGENAKWGRVTLLRRWFLNKLMMEVRAAINQDIATTQGSQLGSGGDGEKEVSFDQLGDDEYERVDDDGDVSDYEGGYYRPDGDPMTIADKIDSVKRRKKGAASAPPVQDQPVQQEPTPAPVSGRNLAGMMSGSGKEPSMASEKNEQARKKLVQYMNNPRAFTLKKWFIELLNNKYTKHDPIVERVAMALSTEQDVRDFGALVAEVFEAGYYKAVNDYKDQAKKAGLEVKVVPSTKNQG